MTSDQANSGSNPIRLGFYLELNGNFGLAVWGLCPIEVLNAFEAVQLELGASIHFIPAFPEVKIYLPAASRMAALRSSAGGGLVR